MPEIFDLAIVWDWEYDHYFVYLIEKTLQQKGITTYRIEYHNIEETIHGVKKNLINFNCLFDRSNEDEFLPIKKYFDRTGIQTINHPKHIKHSNDKATMHLEFITAGLHVPYTIIISPYNSRKEVEFTLSELAHLGSPFIIKPANNTGGGVGVVKGAETLLDILDTRQHQKDDKYLVQEKINPVFLDGKRAWFRCFYAFGKVILTLWDDITHRYELFDFYYEKLFRANRLRRMMHQIHNICKLDFFSSEITLTIQDKLIVVDYVNDICDMRPQSQCFDGVPDSIIEEVVINLSNFIKNKRKSKNA